MPAYDNKDVSEPHHHLDIDVGAIHEVDSPHALNESFSLWSSLGLQYSLTSTPLAVGSYLASVIGVGGSPTFIFGYIFAVGCNLCVCLSLAEIAAVYPHSSGQIYWTSVMAPKKYARGLSYLAAWIASAAYFFLTAATCLLASQLIWALVAVVKTTFIIQPWEYYVLYIAAAAVTFALNAPLFTLYPYMLKSMVIFINTGALFVLIVLLVRTHPKQSASFVFADFVNMTGWKPDGVVFFLGLLPGATAVNGFEGAAHLADEIPHPERNIPRVMFGSALMSALAGLPMVLVYMFCIVSPANLLAPIGGQPIAQLLLDSLDSQALTIITILVYILVMLCAAVCLLTSFSRILWSVARQGALPLSGWVAKVNTYYELPVNAVASGVLLIVAIGAIILGSTTAINAILGAGIVMCYLSYILVVGSLLYTTRAKAFPSKRYFNLRRSGIYFNVISMLWMPFITVWLCFPTYVPVTGSTMNYASAVTGGVFFCAAVNWFAYSKTKYTAPVAMNQIQGDF
ncbi:putative choline and nitrogen mustard permease [Mytilinidion resinicola]|uniref:Choline and nitrogen mustard permease n=1 Tax=Mytilinidion resinicola TaxID=574789 RepID=A0A6A6Z4L3_9PEZI|nr:putative choline and nitrogen mustard permease [Mytilinidion resinicola]KAF2815115.1 putative choline and nitrogen mustard permease [Mytilinidion resinicola]